MNQMLLIAHNLRSSHNVGSLLRTADGLGIHQVWLTGYTPYPTSQYDERLPHMAQKIDRQIHKTALGAEKSVDWQHQADLKALLNQLKKGGWVIAALEQSDKSVSLTTYKAPDKLAIIVGREVEGIEPEIIRLCDQILEIPMAGQKESFNVVQAAAMALYHLKFFKS